MIKIIKVKKTINQFFSQMAQIKTTINVSLKLKSNNYKNYFLIKTR